MMNQFLSKTNRLVIALVGMTIFGVTNAYAGGVYSDGRAFKRTGCPNGAGKVCVAKGATDADMETPDAGLFKACNSSETPAMVVQEKGLEKRTYYHFFAQANAGYKFTGWYDENDVKKVLTDAARNYYRGSVKSGSASVSGDSHAYLDMYAGFIKVVQMSFVTPENGSFVITNNGDAITPAYSSFTVDGAVILHATPADGYKLRGWYTTTDGGVTKNYESFAPTYEPRNFTTNVTIGAEFVPDDGKVMFWNKRLNRLYEDLSDANTDASSGDIIVVVSDGVLGAGDYDIKAGVTLLIPYHDSYEEMTKPNIVHYTSAKSIPAVSIFRKLTLDSGVTINVDGDICVGGSMVARNGGNPSSYPCGPCGMIDMSRGGTINLKDGSHLYAWGYVKGQDMDQGNNTTASGVGVINAASGATVWEDFQVGDWRGGSASLSLYSSRNRWKFFPFQCYTIQNIEVPVSYVNGSLLKCYLAIFGNGGIYDVSFPLVGASADEPLFVLGSGGTMKKWYDPTTDRVCYEAGGATTLDKLSLTVMGQSISSVDYNLPVPANMQIILANNTLTIANPITMHAGAVVEIKNDATLKLNANVYLYDKDDWNTYCMDDYYYRTYYSPSLHFDRGDGKSITILEDAAVIVNGTLDLTGSGRLYATAHGANICGNGGGQVKYRALPSNTTMTQCRRLDSNYSINIRSANMHNDNGTYTKGIASTTFKNVNGRWFTNANSTPKSDKTYNFTYIKSGDVYGTGGSNRTVKSCYSKDKTGLVLQDKWANVNSEGCTGWFVGIDDSHLYNWTLNSAWHQYIKTGSVTTGEGEEAVTTDTYVGSDNKMYYKTDCDFVNAGLIDGNCLYTEDETKKALVDGSLIAVTANTSPDHGYHATADASAYYLCFTGCVWHSATRDSTDCYQISGTTYIWYDAHWLAVQYDSESGLYYSTSSATNVNIYYEYDFTNYEWVLASPVAEVVTATETKQVFSIASAVDKAEAEAAASYVTIRLLKDATTNAELVYGGANNCALDLNGYTLSGSGLTQIIHVNHASAKFIVKDQSAAGTGMIHLTFSANNSRRRAIYVEKGHVVVNSGTIKSENTLAYDASTATKPYASGITVAAGHKLTVNGGEIIGESQINPYGVELLKTSGNEVRINGGTVMAHSTLRGSPYGIYINGGVLYVSGGTIKAIADANNSKATSSVGIYVNSGRRLEMTGGEIISNAYNTSYGISVNRSVTYDSNEPRSETGVTPGIANISGGNITSKTLRGNIAFGIYSLGTTEVSGNTIINVEPYKNSSRATTAVGISCQGDTTTVSGNPTFNVTASTIAYGIRIGDTQPTKYGGEVYNGTVIVNGGTFNVKTTSGVTAYGVYVGRNSRAVTTTHATSSSYYAGNYANAGTATVNDGVFNVTSKTTDAYGIYVETAVTQSDAAGYPEVTATPRCTVNGGKFIAKNTNGTTDGTINYNLAAPENFQLAGGYYNITPQEPASGTYIASGKSVKDVDPDKEKAMHAAGYRKKIAGDEFTVTWLNKGGASLGTTRVEDGKRPVWIGDDPTYTAAGGTFEFVGWSTSDGGDVLSPLPAIDGANATYYACYRYVYAEVTTGGTTTRYYDVSSAWTAAMACEQATIKMLTSAGNLNQMEFRPTPANAIITLDMNGYRWGMNGSKDSDKKAFIKVNKAGCKLIITDNSASGDGSLSVGWAKADTLRCLQIDNGECVLQGGTIKSNNTSASDNAVGVMVNASGNFTMTGGTIEATKDDAAATGGAAAGLYVYGTANLAGGTVSVTHSKNQAIGVYTYNGTASTTNIEPGMTIEVSGKQNSFGVHGYGTVNIHGGAIDLSTTGDNAIGLRPFRNDTQVGSIHISGNPTIDVSANAVAYGVALLTTNTYDATDVNVTIDGGTFTITSNTTDARGISVANNGEVVVNGGSFEVSSVGRYCRGVYATSGGEVQVKGGSFEVTSDYTTNTDTQLYGIYLESGGVVSVEDGSFVVNAPVNGGSNDCVRCYSGATQLDISGGTFSMTKGYGALACLGVTETNITGNPVFTAPRGIYVATWASADGTAEVTIDGGTFYCTSDFAIYAKTHVNGVKTLVGDLTVLDGKFHTKNASTLPIYSSTGTDNLKIEGGYYTSYTSSNVSNLTKYVINDRSTTAVPSSDTLYDDPYSYRYRVNRTFTVTWKDGATTLKTEQWHRNEVPSYGSDYAPSDGNTYRFDGWTPTPAPITSDQVYTAVYTKLDAEVQYTLERDTSIRYEHFADAWGMAQNLPQARIKILSDIDLATGITLNPDSVGGSQPLTLDLNNHVVNCTNTTNNSYALTINKAGCTLVVDDSSLAKGGVFSHNNAVAGFNLRGVHIQEGELVLAGGTLQAKNSTTSSTSGAGAYAVVGEEGTVFTQTGGALLAQCRMDPRAYNTNYACTFNATGGEIEVTSEYTESSTTKWGTAGYGVVLWNNGTFNMSGTASLTVTTGSNAVGVYPYGSSSGYPVVNISGGSITCLTKSGATSRPIQATGTHVTVNISGGDFTANGPAGQSDIEDVVCLSGATANISGGNFHSTTGANCIGVRVSDGTATIGGTAFFDSRHGVVAGDWPKSTGLSTATAYVNGGTFDCAEYVLLAKETTSSTNTVTGTIYVNGGYFKTASGQKICSTSSQVDRLILNGGYYNETSGTTQKDNITTYKSGTTEVSALSPAIVVDDRTYHYQLLTDFDITWLGGDSYSKVEQVKSGVVPTNNELNDTYFLRNDSAFYFTGWDPTPTAVIGDTTYNALGEYHVAKVTVDALDSIFDDFDEAWNYAMEQSNATITLMTNLTRSSSFVYNPTPENARHTLDLNNFTIKENTTDRLLVVNKADAKLTITDNSSEKGGRLYKQMNSSSTVYTCIIYTGELIVAGGKVYAENTKDDSSWHPASAVYVSQTEGAVLSVTGGTLEAKAKYLAYAICNNGTTNVSGGNVIADATTTGTSIGIWANGTTTVSGGTFTVAASSNAIGAYVTGWINADGTQQHNGVMNITGGTFNVSATTNFAQALQATGTGKHIGGTVYTAHGTINVSNGTFNVTCSAATAKNIFAAQSVGWRLYDDSTPQNMIGEAKGEMTISGGTFTVDTRNAGAWVTNNNNIDLLRNYATLNITGGTFTIFQKEQAVGVGCYRNKVTISGDPVFNVHCYSAARGVVAVPWNYSVYCDGNAANNVAEIEVNGGTFHVTATSSNVIGAYSNGRISETGESSVAGYAMSSKITINGGEFICTAPNSVRALYQYAAVSGTYGTANREIYVKGGKFKPQIGTVAADGTVSTVTGNGNNFETGGATITNLAGGYFVSNSRLESDKADTCSVVAITSADVDPEYSNGYRYKIAKTFTLTWDLAGGTVTTAGTGAAVDATGTPNTDMGAGAAITAPVVTKTGYTFSAWSPVVLTTMPAANTTYTAQWTPNTNTPYVVKHYQQNLDGTYPSTPTETNNLEGTTGASVTPVVKSYTGFTAPDAQTVTILADGSQVVTYQYTRNSYNLTWNANGGELSGSYTSGLVLFGATITAPTATRTNYDFVGWDEEPAATMPAENKTYTAQWSLSAVTILWKSEDGSETLETDDAVLIGATPSFDGTTPAKATTAEYTYTFDGWTTEANGEGTFYAIGELPTVSAAATYYAHFTATANVASVKVSSTTTYYTTVLAAMNYARTVADPTITILQDAPLTAKWSISSPPDNWQGILDLNGHTVTGTGTDFEMINVNKTGIKLTIRDSSEGAQGKLTHIEERDDVWGLNVWHGELKLESGTIYVRNTKASQSAVGVCTNTNADAVFTMTGGKVETYAADNAKALYLYGGSATISGGKLLSTSILGETLGAKAYGIFVKNGSSLIVSGADSIYSKAGTRSYALVSGGTTTIGGTPYFIAESPVGAHVLESNSTAAITVNGGTFEAKVTTADQPEALALVVGGTSTMTINNGKFKTNQMNIIYRYPGSTLTLNGGYFNEYSGTDHKTNIGNYCVAPKYVLATTEAEKESVGSAYVWKVVEVTNTGWYADIVDVDNTNSKLILNVTGWASSGWPYTINGVEYQKTAREADRTLKVPYTGAPGDNFAMKIEKASGDEVSNRLYVIPQEITSNTTISANETKNLYVKNEANLIVNANITAHNIYVAPDAKLTINSGKTLTADTIFLRTTAEGAAEMVKNGSIAGTTKLVYTRIIKDKDFHLFGLPLPCPISSVRLSDGLSPAYGTGWLLRSYNEARRANMGADDNNWVSLAAGSTIAGGAGYELYSASNYYREFYFPVSLPTTNKVAVAYTSDGAAGEKQAGWNALVSPFTHTYTNDPAPEDLVVNWYMDGYGYYEQEIPSVIPPAKPFAFQTSEAGYLSFEGSAIAITKMPRRASEEEVQIQWIHLDITDADGIGDQTSVYSHPTRYDAVYQTGIDVAKQSLTAARAIIYSSHAYGEMAFAGVADSLLEQGVALTVYSPTAQSLTISMRENDWLNRMEYVWLIDHETGAATDLLYDTYTFAAPTGTTRGRFTIQGVFKAPQITTDLEPTSDSSMKGREARKVLIDQKMYILLDGVLYDATGKRVNK